MENDEEQERKRLKAKIVRLRSQLVAIRVLREWVEDTPPARVGVLSKNWKSWFAYLKKWCPGGDSNPDAFKGAAV